MASRLKSGQREKLRNFMLVTNAAEPTALHCLRATEFNLELAIDQYYSQGFQDPIMPASSVDTKKIEAMFAKYANVAEDKTLMQGANDQRIGPHGVLRLLKDIDVDPSSLEALMFAWKLKAETQCEFSDAEFCNGLRDMRVDSIEKLRQQVNEWRRGLDDKATLRSLYLFTFAYAKSASTRHLDLETAIAYWTLFLEKRDPRVLQWIEFLRTQDLRAINKDLYCLFFDFLYSTDASYSDYDVNAAWPVLIDEFVEYARKQANAGAAQ